MLIVYSLILVIYMVSLLAKIQVSCSPYLNNLSFSKCMLFFIWKFVQYCSYLWKVILELGMAKAIIVSSIYWYVNVHFSISKLGNSALLLILSYISHNMLKFVYTNKRVIILMYPFHCFSKYKKLSFCKQFFTCNLPIWLLNTSHISIKSNIASFD